MGDDHLGMLDSFVGRFPPTFLGRDHFPGSLEFLDINLDIVHCGTCSAHHSEQNNNQQK
jgi:hypothetical protein